MTRLILDHVVLPKTFLLFFYWSGWMVELPFILFGSLLLENKKNEKTIHRMEKRKKKKNKFVELKKYLRLK